MQLDIEDWTFTQVVLTAVRVGILSGLIFCATPAHILPDAEEPQED
jgi:hypothetical protein